MYICKKNKHSMSNMLINSPPPILKSQPSNCGVLPLWNSVPKECTTTLKQCA